MNPTGAARIPLWCLAIAGGMALAGTGPQQPTSRPPRLPARDFSARQTYAVVGVRAINQIVIQLDEAAAVVVQLQGVAPLTGKDGVPTERAVDFLANLLRGERIYFDAETTAEWEHRPGPLRVQAYRVPDGLSVNLELVRQGYAAHDARTAFLYSEVFAYHAAAARRHRRGLWTPPPEPPRTAVKTDNDGTDERAAADEEADTIKVYATRSGAKYHRAGCRFLRGDEPPLSIKAAVSRGLDPCKHCDPPAASQGQGQGP